jgi:hypothetical protein
MNSYRQWSDANLTIDGFYAEHEEEYVPEDTQVNTTQENNLLNNSSSNNDNNRNASSRNRFQSPENLLGVFLPENPDSSYSSSAPVTARPINAKEDYDEYKNFHFKCMGLRANKGKSMMINNYRSVLHALSG